MRTPPVATATTRPAPIGLYIGITVPLPDRIAARLPESRPGVHPHITLAHAQVSPWQLRRLRDGFEGRAFSATLSGLAPFRIGLRGTGDFRTDDLPTPVVYVKVADGADVLAGLAAAFDVEYGLARRFAFHPHVTLAWRNRDLELAEGDAELDRLVAAYGDFEDGFTVRELGFAVAHGTILAPRTIIWPPQPFAYPLISGPIPAS